MQHFPKKAAWGAGLACTLLVIGGVVMAVMAGGASRHHAGATNPAPAPPDDPPELSEPQVLSVHTIRPKCDPSFTLSVKAPAQVESYEWADLEAQVAGPVAYIRKAEGSLVKAGEVLIKIAVPDLEEEVKQRESIVKQREAEHKIALDNEEIAKAAVVVAAKNVDVKNFEVDVVKALEIYRGKFFTRMKAGAAKGGITQEIVDEAEWNYKAAVADVAKAKAAVGKAEADLLEAHAKLRAATSDTLLKKELIEVARNARDKAQVLADYGKITAPFDGVITRRSVNRGSFVQNATTAHTVPLLRVERRDIVTVSMKVPDEFASLVTNDTEAVIEMSELPGRYLHGKVTRFSPTLLSQTNDHTLLVMVDLYNGSEEDYERFLEKEKATGYADLKEGSLPLLPRVTSGRQTGMPSSLLPGMYGEMRLVFSKLPNVHLLPSDAIVRQGGTPYVWLVKDGKARLYQVEVQVDDQKLAKVVLLRKRANNQMTKRELTADDEVIYSNQSELSDGETVTAIPEDWMPHR
jgi:multidrug efflux pump subunit AcrA (membrane-fusion protein)